MKPAVYGTHLSSAIIIKLALRGYNMFYITIINKPKASSLYSTLRYILAKYHRHGTPSLVPRVFANYHLGSPLSKAGVSITFLSPNGLSSSSSGSESVKVSCLAGAGLGGCGGGVEVVGFVEMERPDRSGVAELGEGGLPV